ncbi:MAG: methyltransferase [Candidatus Aminicenantes bacterium]|nr:methyltransferase [Candidatus Aminicenantes bacterium]
MNSRKFVQETLAFDSPGRIPRQIGVLPWAEEKYPDIVRQMRTNFPDDIVPTPTPYKRPLGIVGDRYSPGTYVDEWGCIFSNPRKGIIGIVQKPLIDGWKDLDNFKTPESVLSLDRDAVNAFCKESECFILAGTFQRPFERLQFIRTMEQALIDLVEQPPELFELIDRIHEHYLKEVEVWARTDVDAISLMDDWGTQNSLITSPDIFRKIFKPLYQEYVEIARHYGKYVFLHSDGYILDILPDLIEIGVDALNSQIFCMGIRELGERYRGKITFWGEIDRQYLLSRGSREEIEQAVYEVWKELYAEGGVIAQCEFDLEAKPENVYAVFETWNSIGQAREKTKR